MGLTQVKLATLDPATGLVPSSQLPPYTMNTVWPAIASQAAMLALPAEPGDVAIRTDVPDNFMLAALPASTLANWNRLADPTAPVTSVAGRTGAITLAEGDIASLTTDLAAKAPLASPALTGAPTAPTPTTGTGIANKTYVDTAAAGAGAVSSVAGKTGAVTLVEGDIASLTTDLAAKAPSASPTLSGTPRAPTQTALDNSTKIATTAYADSAVGVETSRATTAEGLKAPLASPALTGAPTAPTPTTGTGIANKTYVDAAVPLPIIVSIVSDATAIGATVGAGGNTDNAAAINTWFATNAYGQLPKGLVGIAAPVVVPDAATLKGIQRYNQTVSGLTGIKHALVALAGFPAGLPMVVVGGYLSTTSTSFTAASNATITDSLATWTTNQWAGATVTIMTGVGATRQYTITSNTATVLTLSSNFTSSTLFTGSSLTLTPASGDRFLIGSGTSRAQVDSLHVASGSGSNSALCINGGNTKGRNISWEGGTACGYLHLQGSSDHDLELYDGANVSNAGGDNALYVDVDGVSGSIVALVTGHSFVQDSLVTADYVNRQVHGSGIPAGARVGGVDLTGALFGSAGFWLQDPNGNIITATQTINTGSGASAMTVGSTVWFQGSDLRMGSGRLGRGTKLFTGAGYQVKSGDHWTHGLGAIRVANVTAQAGAIPTASTTLSAVMETTTSFPVGAGNLIAFRPGAAGVAGTRWYMRFTSSSTATTTLTGITSGTLVSGVLTITGTAMAVQAVGSLVTLASWTPAAFNGTWGVVSSTGSTLVLAGQGNPGASSVTGTATVQTVSFAGMSGGAGWVPATGDTIASAQVPGPNVDIWGPGDFDAYFDSSFWVASIRKSPGAGLVKLRGWLHNGGGGSRGLIPAISDVDLGASGMLQLLDLSLGATGSSPSYLNLIDNPSGSQIIGLDVETGVLTGSMYGTGTPIKSSGVVLGGVAQADLPIDSRYQVAGNIPESQVTNLITDLAAKAPLASPALTGSPTAPTQTALDNSTKVATTAYTDAAAALKAPIASPTFTGTTTAPFFVASGLTGATAASRYVGATTSGAPVSGTFAVGDYIIDQTGTIWTCITAGTPGKWLPGGSGVELAEAELSADFTMSATVMTDITGLTVTVTAPSRAFMVEMSIPEILVGATTQYAQFQIADSANTLLAFSFAVQGSAATGSNAVFLRSRLPRTGTGAYPITVGNSYTFKGRYSMSAVGGGNGSLLTTSGTTRPILRVVTC